MSTAAGAAPILRADRESRNAAQVLGLCLPSDTRDLGLGGRGLGAGPGGAELCLAATALNLHRRLVLQRQAPTRVKIGSRMLNAPF